MIVISFLLVIVAAVTLIIGLFQDDLGWIWASIASCVLAMVFLGIGVLQRRGAPATAGAPDEDGDDYSSGAVAGLVGGGRDEDGEGPRPEQVTVVPKRTVADARQAISESGSSLDEASARASVVTSPSVTEEEPATAASAEEATTGTAEKSARKATKKPSKKATKKATKKASKKASKKAAKRASKKATKKATKKAAKKAAKRTTGAAARDRLAEVPGVGEGKADALLSRFGSLEAVRDASVDELTSVKGIGAATAEKLRDQL